MKKLRWVDDKTTLYWAERVNLIRSDQPLSQYDGRQSYGLPKTWQKHLPEGKKFPPICLVRDSKGREVLFPSPGNIMECFREGLMLEGLVLVILWGTMTRTKGRIYTDSLNNVALALQECDVLVRDSGSVMAAWELLVSRMGWSNVIASKILHFLARSLGFANPPVPIDNAVVKNKLWPLFMAEVGKFGRRRRDASEPDPWDDRNHSWEAYNRYMTFINCSADKRGWTTTQVENTLFRELM